MLGRIGESFSPSLRKIHPQVVQISAGARHLRIAAEEPQSSVGVQPAVEEGSTTRCVGRVEHALLLEVLTNEGVGTMIRSDVDASCDVRLRAA